METLGDFVKFFKKDKHDIYNFSLSDPFPYKGWKLYVGYIININQKSTKEKILAQLQKSKNITIPTCRNMKAKYNNQTIVRFVHSVDDDESTEYIYDILFDLLCNK